MKVNKTIIIGLIFIFFAGLLFITDIFNPVIRPITYLFLMGSSKGKDIMFFGLMGLFLILPQLVKGDFDPKKYLKISIVMGWVLLICGIILEVVFRMQMGIKLNTVFCSMTSTMSSTSILHTHLLKSILGALLSQIIGPFIQSDINTGSGLYQYVPSFGTLVILLIPILFVTLILAIRNRSEVTSFLLAFLSSCLIIGAIDGGMFGTPALVGILGLCLMYRNGNAINDSIYCILENNNPFKEIKEVNQVFTNVKAGKWKDLFNQFLIVFAVLAIILLRFTIAFAGAEPDYYTVDVANPEGDIDLGNITPEIIDNHTTLNKTTYHIKNDYNEMDLINDLKVPLNNSCEYYTVSWNIYSYFNVI